MKKKASDKITCKAVNAGSPYEVYQNRTKLPLEHIAELCLDIQRADLNYKNVFDEVPKAKEDAQIMLGKYNEIISLIPAVDIKDYPILTSILHICAIHYPLNVLGDQYHKIKLNANGKDTDLYRAIKDINYNFEISKKHEEYFYQQYKAEHEAMLVTLEKKGERICQRYYYEWYRNHVNEYGKWVERSDYQKQIVSKTFPWENDFSRIKIGSMFGPSKQKIEILDIGTCGALLQYGTKENSVIYDSSVIGWNEDCIAVKNIGSVNDGIIEVFNRGLMLEYANQHNLKKLFQLLH